jgi:hypothetical protein
VRTVETKGDLVNLGESKAATQVRVGNVRVVVEVVGKGPVAADGALTDHGRRSPRGLDLVKGGCHGAVLVAAGGALSKLHADGQRSKGKKARKKIKTQEVKSAEMSRRDREA